VSDVGIPGLLEVKILQKFVQNVKALIGIHHVKNDLDFYFIIILNF